MQNHMQGGFPSSAFNDWSHVRYVRSRRMLCEHHVLPQASREGERGLHPTTSPERSGYKVVAHTTIIFDLKPT